jgi:hypothetical protein
VLEKSPEVQLSLRDRQWIEEQMERLRLALERLRKTSTLNWEEAVASSHDAMPSVRRFYPRGQQLLPDLDVLEQRKSLSKASYDEHLLAVAGWNLARSIDRAADHFPQVSIPESIREAMRLLRHLIVKNTLPSQLTIKRPQEQLRWPL